MMPMHLACVSSWVKDFWGTVVEGTQTCWYPNPAQGLPSLQRSTLSYDSVKSSYTHLAAAT
jgi:hypothetical protein